MVMNQNVFGFEKLSQGKRHDETRGHLSASRPVTGSQLVLLKSVKGRSGGDFQRLSIFPPGLRSKDELETWGRGSQPLC